MSMKEPFAAAMRRPDGMLRSEGFKDDPRWQGGHILKPDIEHDIVLRPRIEFLLLRIVTVLIALGLGLIHPAIYYIMLAISVMIMAETVVTFPKLFIERTVITHKGIERWYGPYRMFFPWENFHNYSRDSLALNLRMIRPWGIWMDDYNLIVSNLYYSSADIMTLESMLYLSNNNNTGHPPHPGGDEMLNMNG